MPVNPGQTEARLGFFGSLSNPVGGMLFLLRPRRQA
jgi:hypothetical protein